jgi:ADP-dependent NAD(P)H-hydrate dehydratase / NAD(P)H-hydrate epimerase
MHRVLSRDQIRAFDRFAIQNCNVPGIVLMENAGRGAAEVIQSLLSDDVEHVLVVCGTGNNGGDGFVVARHLASFGAPVSVCLLGAPEKLHGDALTNHDAFMGLGGHITIVADDASLPVLETELMHADFVVDAIFGTGLDREVTGRFAEVIDRINATPATRVALDLPSGLDANTGAILGTAVVADTTITFGALKTGLLTPMGSRMCGDIHVAGLGVPSAILEQTGHEAEILVGARVRAMVERIRTQARIIEDGSVAIVLSNPDDAWAARLAARASLRTAPGTVKLLVTPAALDAVRDLACDVVIETLDPKHLAKSLVKAWSDADALVFPVATPSDMPAIRQARKSFQGVVVVGVTETLGSKAKQLCEKGGDLALVTDGAGLGAMLRTDAESVEADRFGSVRALVQLTDATLVLADAQPVVGVPGTAMGVRGQRLDALNARGLRAVACGAMGRMACWSEASVAALAGLYVTAAAVEKWAEDRKGRGGPLAQEIADLIPSVL